MRDLIHVSDEVQTALEEERAVVALETTLVAHGFPAPDGVETGLASEAAVRTAGAVPATIGVLDGRIRIGLDEGRARAVHTRSAQARPARPRASAPSSGRSGRPPSAARSSPPPRSGSASWAPAGSAASTAAFPTPPDVSADLSAAARIPAVVVSSGVKSLLDVPATVELLETLGVPVIGYRTDTLPLFYDAAGGPPVSARVENAGEIAQHRRRALASRRQHDPRRPTSDREPRRRAADRGSASRPPTRGCAGQAVTPFVLAYLHERSGGETRRVNRDLIVAQRRSRRRDRGRLRRL